MATMSKYELDRWASRISPEEIKRLSECEALAPDVRDYFKKRWDSMPKPTMEWGSFSGMDNVTVSVGDYTLEAFDQRLAEHPVALSGHCLKEDLLFGRQVANLSSGPKQEWRRQAARS